MTTDNIFAPIPPPRPSIPMPESEVVEEVVEEAPAPKPAVKINNGDDMSDLFQAPKMTDADMVTDDLINVDIDKDIIDGDLSDITTVSDADIMGFAPKKQPKVVRRVRFKRTGLPYPQPPTMGGIR